METQISNWHDICDPYITLDVTTPTIAEPTRTLGQGICEAVPENCYHLSEATDACSSSYTIPADFTSCRCESSMLSLASVCKIDGLSCDGLTATKSHLWEFRECPLANAVTHHTLVSAR
jgi:hypothetical protein